MTIRIRDYEPADRDALLALAPRLLTGMPPWRDAAAWLTCVEGWVASAADGAGDTGHAVYVAVDGEHVAGFVHVTQRTHFTGDADAYVGELVTAAGQERRGIARALMHAAEEWGAARGLRLLTLETGAANHEARAFYAALGYETEDVRLTKHISGERAGWPTRPLA